MLPPLRQLDRGIVPKSAHDALRLGDSPEKITPRHSQAQVARLDVDVPTAIFEIDALNEYRPTGSHGFPPQNATPDRITSDSAVIVLPCSGIVDVINRDTVRTPSVFRIGAFAQELPSLVQGERRALLCADLSVVGDTPFGHLVGIDEALLDSVALPFGMPEARRGHGEETEVRVRDVIAAHFPEPCIVFRCRPDHDDKQIVQGDILSIRYDAGSLGAGPAESMA